MRIAIMTAAGRQLELRVGREGAQAEPHNVQEDEVQREREREEDRRPQREGTAHAAVDDADRHPALPKELHEEDADDDRHEDGPDGLWVTGKYLMLAVAASNGMHGCAYSSIG